MAKLYGIKNKTVSARINSEVYDLLKKSGGTIQGIIDLWIEENIEVDIEIKIKGGRNEKGKKNSGN